VIRNFDEQNLEGIVVLNSDANIEIKGDINVAKDSLLVVRIDDSHAFTDVAGNTVTLGENSKIMLETNNLAVGKDGKAVIDLAQTKINAENIDIIASQYIYDINKIPTVSREDVSDKLEVSVKSLDSMGLNSKYQLAFDSVVSSGNLSSINDSFAFGNKLSLENLLGQIVEFNPYALSTKMSRDSMETWNNGVKSLRNMPKLGEWMVQATGTGNYTNNNGDLAHESRTTGLLATAEYGIMQDTSLGLAFGGGKQTGKIDESLSELESDSFYVGAFGKKNINNFKLLGSLGYQKNKFDGKRVIDNGLNKFDFDNSFDTDGFNVMAEARYVMPVKDTLTLEPKLVLDYTHISQDSIDEGEKP
ncbi:MAG: autotransporter outer membrane beta-barrel domain-containing protein, partial [Cetobacterium sp.]